MALFALLGACGGGGSGSSSSSTPAATALPTLTLSTSTSSVSSATPATLTASVKTAAGAAIPGVVVTFATTGTGFASFFPSGGTSLTDASGNANISLNAGATVGADSVKATATANGVALTSNTVGFTVSATPVTATPAAISFVSATPATIAIRGAGGVENSSVIFTVRDTNGNPLAGQVVNFSLNTSVGGVSLTATTATSSSDGTATAILRSGTTATPVRVTASLASNSAVTTVSSQLVVSTAIPHQNGFSISSSALNIEALTIDGVSATITARLSDRYGNFVPDGTAVSFRTEGGVSSITPSCVTRNGICTVDFTSSGRRPADGRLTILATAIGEESFTDLNGNGVYDIGEPFTDLPEAFIDGDENGVRGPNSTEPTAPLEEFVDFNRDGLYTLGDGLFNGVLRTCDLTATPANPIPPGCPSVSGVAPPTTVNVRASIVITLSGSTLTVGGLPSTIALTSCPTSTPSTFNVTVSDSRGNAPARNTRISVSTTNGTISTPTSFVVPDIGTAGPYVFALTLQTDATNSGGICTNPSSSGALTITATTPSGIISTRTVPVTD